MILIADSGATKTDWCCMGNNGARITFKSEGYNPNYITQEYMIRDLHRSIPGYLDKKAITRVFFYGSGVTELQYDFIKQAVYALFPGALVFVAMDLLGAARALLGHTPGFAAILGTGTNSCLYDGEKITHNIDSLGFILGDEGSGAYLGKRLICDFIREQMPEKARKITADAIRLSGDQLIDAIYNRPFPNRFCAQYCTLIGENLQNDEYFYQLVRDSFRELFKNIISRYPDYKQYPFNCTGSAGYAYKEILSGISEEYGMPCGKIIPYPMEGLIEYHKKDMD